MWYKNEFDESYYLEKENGRLVCSLHPKPNIDYVYHLGIKVFGTEENFNKWYYKKNFWYGDQAPVEMTYKKVIEKIMQIEYNAFI